MPGQGAPYLDPQAQAEALKAFIARHAGIMTLTPTTMTGRPFPLTSKKARTIRFTTRTRITPRFRREALSLTSCITRSLAISMLDRFAGRE